MNDQGTMVAMIRTLLYFMGKQNYMPTATDVTPILREALLAQALVAPSGDDWGKSAPLQWNAVAPSTSTTNSTVMLPLGARQQRAR